MASFRRGAEAIQAAKESTGKGAFKPVFTFEEGTKYLQFLTAMDDVPTVLMHQFITVGYREDGKPKYERFISRRDPALDGPEGYDELIDRFGSNPSQRSIAVAVELEPIWKMNGTKKVLDGFDIVEREYESNGETKAVPNVALVIESPHTLFGHLSSLNDLKPLENYVWAITVAGKGKDKTFTATDVGAALDFEGELDSFLEEIDFDGWLDELSDEDRMRELIGDLPDDFVVNKFAKKGKGGGKQRREAEEKEPARSTRTRRTREPEAVEADVDEPEAEETEEVSAAPRRRRFAELRSELKQ